MDEKLYQVNYENFVLFSKNFERKKRRERRKISREGKYIFAEETKHGEGKGGLYLEKEIIFFAEEKKNREGKGRKYLEKETIFLKRRRKT